MRRLSITGPARGDLADIRRYSVERYGRTTADAYNGLLKQALQDIRDDPYRPVSKERPDIGENIRSYHTALSKTRAVSTIKSPRHFILYFLPDEDEVVVSRVLHDSRDLARHIPADHLEQARQSGSSQKE